MPRPTLFDHPKFHRLVHVLGVCEAQCLGHLEFLWRVGYSSGNPIIGDEIDIEISAKWIGERGALVRALCDPNIRLLDKLDDGRYQIHDFFDHAPRYVQDRWRKEQERKGKRKPKKRRTSGGHAADSPPKTADKKRPPTPAPSPAPSPAHSPTPTPEKTLAAPPPATARPRDELFDAIAEVTGSDPKVSGSHIAKVKKQLLTAEPPYTPAEVRRFPVVLSAQNWSTPLTLGTLEKYIGWVRTPPARSPPRNGKPHLEFDGLKAFAAGGQDGKPK